MRSRILVIRGGALGDFILTLPALKLLRDAFPAARIEILGYQHIVALAKMSGYADATRSIEYAPLSTYFAREGELAPELIEYFGGFQQIISYLFDPDEIFAANLRRSGVRNLICVSPKIDASEHAARQLARPLERLGLYLENPAATIAPNESVEVDRTIVALHPGSGSERKNWPLEHFIETARHLLLPNEKRKLLLIGGEAEIDRLTRLRSALPNDRVAMAQDLALPQLALRLRSCGFFIGHDSGISHLAAAVGIPSLLLFGPTDAAVWAPLNPQVRVLRAPDRTMRGIEVRQVLERLGELLPPV